MHNSIRTFFLILAVVMIAIPTIGQTDEPNIDVNCLGGKPNAPIRMEVLAIEILRECGADGWVEKYENDLAALA